jgi:fibronectin type 3 domain-containing protein
VAVLLAGCGYVGEPLPPLANVPAKVTDLAAVQRGSTIVAQFSAPYLTTEEKPLPRPVKLDLRVGLSEPFQEGDWLSHAKAIAPAPMRNGVARYEIPSDEWTGKAVAVGVRVIGGNGKMSAWSNFVSLPVVPAPEKPVVAEPVATAVGVKLTWKAKGPQFRVFRKPEGAEDFTLAATVDRPEWTDADAEFGKATAYLVQSVVKLEENKFAESELSSAVSLTPVDKFPPAAPVELHGTAGPGSVELSWEPNTESDLAGYRVYRSVEGGAFEKIAEVTAVPSYSDKAVEHGKKYRYAIAAFDRAGNESPRSAPAEVVME